MQPIRAIPHGQPYWIYCIRTTRLHSKETWPSVGYARLERNWDLDGSDHGWLDHGPYFGSPSSPFTRRRSSHWRSAASYTISDYIYRLLHRDPHYERLCAFLSCLRVLAHSSLLLLDFKSVGYATGDPQSRSDSGFGDVHRRMFICTCTLSHRNGPKYSIL